MATNNNSIQTIKQYFTDRGGLQLSNRFQVSFRNIPTFVTDTVGGPNYVFQAQQIDIGPRALNFVQDNLAGYGYGRFVPRSQQLMAGGNGILITFPVTNDNSILEVFNVWFDYFFSNNVIEGRKVYMLPYYDRSIKNVEMQIDILDPNGKINSSMNFTEVFPVETQPIFMTMLKNDSYMTYTVLFGYRDFIHNFPNQN
jgi:hypothetical protein